jgi:hypothetical protein
MRVLQRNEGYAIVAAVLMLFLVTGLGIVAMVTSGTEQTINTNLNESQLMFFYAQQSIDRVISHLSYLEGGLFTTNKGLGLNFRGVPDPINTANNPTDLLLPTVQVLADNSDTSHSSRQELYFTTTGTNNTIGVNPNMHVEAYLDPQDLQAYFDRGISRPVAITALVRNNFTKVQRVFRAYVRPHSIWDYAYFAMNQTPWQRTYHSATNEFCNAPSTTWRNCQTVLLNEDIVNGDLYIGNTVYEPNNTNGSNGTYYTEQYFDGTNTNRQTTALFVRGVPAISGEARWRDLRNFTNATNQTYGGQSVQQTVQPNQRFRNSVKPIMPPRLETILQPPTGQMTTYREMADLYLYQPTRFNFAVGSQNYSNQKTVWKILFRTDIWPNEANNGTPCANGDNSVTRVTSRITHSVNCGQSPLINCPNFDKYPGAMMVYRLPFPDPANPTPLDNDMWQAAMYGDNMSNRNNAMNKALVGATSHNLPSIMVSGQDFNDQQLDFGKSYFDARAIMTRNNNSTPGVCPGTAGCHGPYNPYDISPSYTFLAAPARGFTPPNVDGDGSNQQFNGIIFVEGDVLVSGIVRGQITIVATGDIYLDHEVQYETNPAFMLVPMYNDLRQPDMLALIAGGNIIIPNSYPGSYQWANPALWRHQWRDDWSDPDNTLNNLPYTPVGLLDTPPVLDDKGNKNLNAVLISYGFQCTRGSVSGNRSSTFNCISPDMAPGGSAAWQNIAQFRTGLYAQARTVNMNWYGDLSFPPYPNAQAFDQLGGNGSGTITIIGAVVQNIAGRLAYDDVSSTCRAGGGPNDTSGTCNKMGFSSITYQYDTRLKFLLPPYPGELGLGGQKGPATTANVVPFGYAAWEITAWQLLPDTEPIADNVW